MIGLLAPCACSCCLLPLHARITCSLCMVLVLLHARVACSCCLLPLHARITCSLCMVLLPAPLACSYHLLPVHGPVACSCCMLVLHARAACSCCILPFACSCVSNNPLACNMHQTRLQPSLRVASNVSAKKLVMIGRNSCSWRRVQKPSVLVMRKCYPNSEMIVQGGMSL